MVTDKELGQRYLKVKFKIQFVKFRSAWRFAICR